MRAAQFRCPEYSAMVFVWWKEVSQNIGEECQNNLSAIEAESQSTFHCKLAYVQQEKKLKLAKYPPVLPFPMGLPNAGFHCYCNALWSSFVERENEIKRECVSWKC